jgi:alcohol dehydrogenase
VLADRTIDLLLRDRVRFGAGSIAGLPDLIRELGGPAGRAFIVSDPGVVGSGMIATVAEVLSRAGVASGLFGAVEPNPGTAVVERGGAALRAFGTEGVIVVPVGGGSSMDTAKAMGYDNPSLVAGLPLVAVPTTAGTGAETNSFGVITDEAVGRKSYIGHPSLLPRACILDPVLTLGLPPAATAATGLDAMTHSLESLLSRQPNPFAEALALQVIRIVGQWLPRAVAEGTDLEARGQLLLASHLAGIGQASGTGVGLVHALGHALGIHGRLAHGTALAAVLPEVLAFYVGTRDRELALVGIALGVASPRDPERVAAGAGVDGVAALIVAVGQRRTLRELGLGPDAIPALVADALADPAINNSPRLPSVAEVTAILTAVAG